MLLHLAWIRASSSPCSASSSASSRRFLAWRARSCFHWNRPIHARIAARRKLSQAIASVKPCVAQIQAPPGSETRPAGKKINVSGKRHVRSRSNASTCSYAFIPRASVSGVRFIFRNATNFRPFAPKSECTISPHSPSASQTPALRCPTVVRRCSGITTLALPARFHTMASALKLAMKSLLRPLRCKLVFLYLLALGASSFAQTNSPAIQIAPSEHRSLSPGKTPGTFVFAYTGKVRFTQEPAFPVTVEVTDYARKSVFQNDRQRRLALHALHRSSPGHLLDREQALR